MRRSWLALLLLASPAAADEPIRHVVRSGESCAAIAERYYGDPRLVDLLHGANPELAAKPPPHALREGMVLVVPPKPGGDATTRAGAGAGADAELTAVQNRVEVLAPEPKRGKANDPLFRGNRVSTEAASTADVTFRDETQVRLGERTLVVILGDARAAAARVNRTVPETTLVTGSLRAFMAGARPGSGARVATDAAKVRVYDGEAQVTADASKTTRLAVYRGSGAIEAGGRTREVARGFGSKAELGKPPSEPRPLPASPGWASAPALVLRDNGDGKGTLVAGEYAATPSTVRVAEWHVQIARDGIFRDVAVDVRVAAEITRLEGHVPTSGRYYVRVSARDDDGFEGPFSPIARTLVIQATKTDLAGGQRSIAIDPPDAFCVRVGNVPLTRLEGQSVVVPKSEPVRIRCAPSKTDPTTLFSVN